MGYSEGVIEFISNIAWTPGILIVLYFAIPYYRRLATYVLSSPAGLVVKFKKA
jgi:hypothetical protein